MEKRMINLETLDPELKGILIALFESSLLARNGSYSPYSKFRVGASLLTEEGITITGANVESASYGATICAERTAIVKAVSEGQRSFLALAIASDLSGPCSPCGICRQLLREFVPPHFRIYLVPANYNPKHSRVIPLKEYTELIARDPKEVEGNWVVFTRMEEILPMSFGPGDLDRPRMV